MRVRTANSVAVKPAKKFAVKASNDGLKIQLCSKVTEHMNKLRNSETFIEKPQHFTFSGMRNPSSYYTSPKERIALMKQTAQAAYMNSFQESI